MTTPDRELTQPRVLEVTLRKVTERLAKELACPTQRAPDWSGFEWTVARAVAAMHGVSPLLSRTLRWQGPAGWVQFLEEQRTHTAKRHARIEKLLRLIDQAAREAGVAVVALKGAALHGLGVYRVGDRPMADIDLLVEPADATGTAKMLESLGFLESRKNWKERVFTPIDGHSPGPLGEHWTNNVKIELHDRICEKLPLHITDISEFVRPQRPRPGLNTYPSKASLMIHLLLHAAGSMAFKGVRLLQLHDIAQLSLLMTGPDWDEVMESNAEGRTLWWAFPPLQLSSRYYPFAIPARVLSALRDDCPYWLERISRGKALYDVSYSYLWVDALPGIEWSRTFHEVVGYVVDRVRPGAEHVASRGRAAETEAWAQQCQWIHLSQGRRILRWLTSRPTRPVTMHAVRAALAQAQ